MKVTTGGQQKMTPDNVAKREEARQVWRLNKKEGVPVLEALETANISKDTYYEYKREYEEQWESNLLTIEEVEERLEELSDELSDLSELADHVEGRLEEAEDSTELTERTRNAKRKAESATRTADEVKRRVETLEDRVGYQYDPEKDAPPVTLRELSSRLTEFRHVIEDVQDEVDGAHRRIDDLEKRHDSDVGRLQQDIRKVADWGVLGMITESSDSLGYTK